MSLNYTRVVDINVNELLNLAIEAANVARQKILLYTDPSNIEFKSQSTNPVTLADKSSEQVIMNLLKRARPHDGFLGEEGSEVQSKTGLRWVFDPLDGTVNYIYRIPHCAISIACETFEGTQWKPIVGVVYDVTRNEVFSAIKSLGATMNGSKISVNELKDSSKALISTEFSYCRDKRIYQAEIFSNLLKEVRDIRSSGSSALDLCWVACGRFDGFYEDELSLWDWSAGSLIVKEAGGSITPLGTGVIASPKNIHKRLCELVER